jgi:hypothetical protein
MSSEVISAILKPGSRADGADEEDLKAVNQR